ncbi:hypothetical protein ACFXKG_40530, partial [Streptomyces sp. NPDC059255]
MKTAYSRRSKQATGRWLERDHLRPLWPTRTCRPATSRLIVRHRTGEAGVDYGDKLFWLSVV